MNLVERAKNIILTPSKEWEVIKTEQLSSSQMMLGYAAILALIPAIAGFIGRSLVGISFFGVTEQIPFARGITWAVLYYIMSLVGVYVLAFIIDALAPGFGAQKDMNASLKVAVFASTASWLAGIFAILPLLGLLSIVGLYSLFLLYGGMKIIKAPPQEKLMGYYIITILVAVGIYVVIGVVVTAITLGSYLAGKALGA